MKPKELHAIEMRIVQMREESRLPKIERSAPYVHHTTARTTERRGTKVLRALAHLGTATIRDVAEYVGHGMNYAARELVRARRLGWVLETLTIEPLSYTYTLTDAGRKELGPL